MISSHSLDFFAPSGNHPAEEKRVWDAARALAKTMTEVCPQGRGLERALAYVSIAAMVSLHSIDTTE